MENSISIQNLRIFAEMYNFVYNVKKLGFYYTVEGASHFVHEPNYVIWRIGKRDCGCALGKGTVSPQYSLLAQGCGLTLRARCKLRLRAVKGIDSCVSLRCAADLLP